MNKKRANIFVLFVTPNPAIALCVGIWDYGNKITNPTMFAAKDMIGVTNILAKKNGYRVFQNTKDGFECYLVFDPALDAEKVVRAAKTFLVEVATGLLAGYKAH